MPQPNRHYFDISIDKPEGLDTRYMALDWHKDIEQYVAETKKLKELLATIKTLRSRGENADRIYESLRNLTFSTFASKSELSCFVNACDATFSTLKSDFAAFKTVVDLYLQHRDFTEETPKEWIQAIIDKGASRAQGSIGENKLIEIAGMSGFALAENWPDLAIQPKAVAKFSKTVFKP